MIDDFVAHHNIHHPHRRVYAAGHAGIQHTVGSVAVDKFVGPYSRRHFAYAALGEDKPVVPAVAEDKERRAVPFFPGIFEEMPNARQFALHSYDNSYFHL